MFIFYIQKVYTRIFTNIQKHSQYTANEKCKVQNST